MQSPRFHPFTEIIFQLYLVLSSSQQFKSALFFLLLKLILIWSGICSICRGVMFTLWGWPYDNLLICGRLKCLEVSKLLAIHHWYLCDGGGALVGLSYGAIVVCVVESMLSLSVAMHALTVHGDEGASGGMCVLAVHGDKEVVVIAVMVFAVVGVVVRFVMSSCRLFHFHYSFLYCC